MALSPETGYSLNIGMILAGLQSSFAIHLCLASKDFGVCGLALPQGMHCGTTCESLACAESAGLEHGLLTTNANPSELVQTRLNRSSENNCCSHQNRVPMEDKDDRQRS